MTVRARVLVPILAAVSLAVAFQPQSETARWEQQAHSITIVRDDWGIAHVYGKTDADAVFGADLRAGRGRLQPRRDELHQLAGPARRGGGRSRDLAATCG